MSDIKLTDDLDFFVEDGIVQEQQNNETTLMQYIFSDARIANNRGYWSNEVTLSKLWKYDQARVNQNTANNIREDMQTICNKAVENKLFDKINTEVLQEGNTFGVRVMAYNKKDVVLDRKFKV